MKSRFRRERVTVYDPAISKDDAMPDDQRKLMLKWLKRHWMIARWQRSIANGSAAFLVLTSIFASFASSIIIAGFSADVPRGLTIVLAALPGLCLTIWRQFPFHEWARFQVIRYISYREIYFLLEYGTIDVGAAVKKINSAGRLIATSANALPYIGFPEANSKESGRISEPHYCFRCAAPLTG